MATSYPASDRSSTGYELFGTSSPVTGTAPTDPTDGLPIKDLVGISVQVSAGGAVNLGGAGTLDCYLRDDVVGRWARAKGLDLTVDWASGRCQGFEAALVSAPRNGRVKWVPNGVTFAGGGTGGVEVWILGNTNQGLYR